MNVIDCLDQVLDAPPTAVNLRRAFTLLTQIHFSDASNYGLLRTQLEDVVWNDDPEKRTLLVALQHDFDTQSASSAIPAVYFGFGDTDFEQEVVSDEAGMSDDNAAVTRVVQAKATLQWVCLARSADFAGNLAETCFSFFSSIKDFLMRTLRLRSFILSQMSMPVQVRRDGAEPYYRVDIRGVVFYNHVLTIHTESHRLKKVEVGAESDFGSGLESTVA